MTAKIMDKMEQSRKLLVKKDEYLRKVAKLLASVAENENPEINDYLKSIGELNQISSALSVDEDKIHLPPNDTLSPKTVEALLYAEIPFMYDNFKDMVYLNSAEPWVFSKGFGPFYFICIIVFVVIMKD